MATSNDSAASSTPQRRRRIGRACDMCRQRKVKCDGAKPKCKSCFLFEYDCTYTDSLSRRAPYKDFNEVLESRLMRIESTVSKLVQTQPTIAQHLLTQLQSLNDPLGEDERRLLAEPQPEPTEDEYPTMDEFADNSLTDSSEDEDFESGLSNLSLEDRSRCKYFGPSSGMYLLNQGKFYKNSYLFDRKYLKAPGGSSNPEIEFELMCDPTIDFLTPESLNQLLEMYFSRFHPYLPLFHKGDFLNRLNSNEKPPAILVNSVLAVACAHSGNSELYSNPAKAGSPGDVFFNRAKNLLDKQYRVSQVSTVQALVLMTVYSSDGWLFLGMAIRMALDIGLHRHLKKPSRNNMSFAEVENRKRAWWACFVVDRFVSASLGRPISIDENDFDTKMIYTSEEEPINYRSSSTSSENSHEHPSPQQNQSDISLRYFVQLIKLNFIFGRVLKAIYSVRPTPASTSGSVLIVFSKILCEWKASLPSEFRYNVRSETNTPFAEIICTLFDTVLISLHRPFLPKVDQIVNLEEHPSVAICTLAANMITFIQHRALRDNYGGGIPMKMVGMYNSSSIHLFNFFSPIPFISRAARSNLIVSLDILEKHWMFSYAATTCLIFLKELLNDRKINLDNQGPVMPELLDKEIPCPNPATVKAFPPKRNDSEVMLLLSENSVQHSSHTPGSTDNMGRSSVVFNPNEPVPQPNISGFANNNFDIPTNFNNSNGFNLADSMFANVPSGDLNNFGYVGQPPLYPNIIPPFVNVPIPNNINLNNSPLLFNGFPTSMDVEEWNTYMDQNMLRSAQINSMDYINMQSGWSPSTGV